LVASIVGLGCVKGAGGSQNSPYLHGGYCGVGVADVGANVLEGVGGDEVESDSEWF
jgi:hypothetical protein